MFIKIIKINFFFIFITAVVFADIINNIKVSGNKRISDQTIIVYGDIELNKEYNEIELNDILKNLYETNFFKTININIESTTLNIIIEENPIIESISISGIKKKSLREELLAEVSLKERTSFIESLFLRDINLITNLIKRYGYYFVKIENSKIYNKELNTVNISYDIILGPKAKIANIEFIGDKKIKDRKLRSLITSEEDKFWKFISNNSYLEEGRIELDNRLILNYYKNNGYYYATVENSFVEFLDDGTFKLIFNINAGKKYFFNDFILKLPLDYDQSNFDELQLLFSKLKGKSYSLNSIDEILSEIDKIVLNKQYEFLKSSVKSQIKGNLINFTFNIDESEKFYVEKINIYGNNITQEDVLRNILLVDEGDAFNELLHNKTINSLKSLNFFSSVDSKIINGQTQSQKIINITVEEKPTGEISAGAGIGTSGATIAFGLKENNFLGRGIKVGGDLSIAANSLTGLISVNNPNYKGSNRSVNFSAERSTVDRKKNFGYQSNKTGFTLGSGFDYYNDLYLNIGVSTYLEKLETDSKASASIKKQEGSYFDTFFNYTLDYDKRNQKYQPSDGFRSRFTQKIPLISESYSLTNTYSLKFYEEWLNQNILSYGFYTSAINSISSKNVRLSDRLNLSQNLLRGFENGQVGPKDGTDFIGGNYIFAFNASTTMPQILPTFQNTSFSLFFDAANVWGIDYSKTLKDESSIKSSVGIAVDLFTPVGPLSFSLAQPITKGKNDVEETFRFNLGTTF